MSAEGVDITAAQDAGCIKTVKPNLAERAPQ